jgi:hypothetical protein
MHICPKCNVEVSLHYEHIPGIPDYQRRELPKCSCGRVTSNAIIGSLQPSPLWFSFVRAFLLSFVCLTASIIIDLDLNQRHFLGISNLLVKIALVICVVYGMSALSLAVSWATGHGPVRRLVSLAAGTAFGFLLPALLVVDGVLYGPLAWIRPFLAQHLQPYFL